MSKESLEHLSSLMDGEHSSEAGMFLTRRLASDEEMCATWERYHLIRDCIRQPGSKHVVTGLSVRVSESIEQEAPVVVPQRQGNRWLKPLSGVAIAASVALVAIVTTTPRGIEPGQGAATANKPFVSPDTVQIPVSQNASFKQPSSDRLNAYLLRHNQMARTAGRQGFVSFVPIVATASKPAEKQGKYESGTKPDPGSETKVTSNQ